MNFVVFDLDDTLACTDHRQYILDCDADYENESEKWNAFFDACVKDQPIRPVINIFNALVSATYEHQNRIEIWTGRSDRVREQTEMWLTFYLKEFSKHHVALRMRTEGDFRADTEIKAEWIEQYGKPDLVFDDRNKMVNWWREQGIVCCQVKESTF